MVCASLDYGCVIVSMTVEMGVTKNNVVSILVFLSDLQGIQSLSNGMLIVLALNVHILLMLWSLTSGLCTIVVSSVMKFV